MVTRTHVEHVASMRPNSLCVKKRTSTACARSSVSCVSLVLSLDSCQSTNLLSLLIHVLGVRVLVTGCMCSFYSINGKPLKARRTAEKATRYDVAAFCSAAAVPQVQTHGQQMGPVHAG